MAKQQLPDELPKKQFAEFVNLTTRQVSNLQEAGLPVVVRGTRVYVKWPEGLHWYIRRLKSKPDDDVVESKRMAARLQEIELEMKEIELAKERESVVTLDYMEAQLAGALERLRAKLLNMPGKYAPGFVGLRTIAEAQVRFEGVVTEAMLALSDTGEDPELDDDHDASEREAAVA